MAHSELAQPEPKEHHDEMPVIAQMLAVLAGAGSVLALVITVIAATGG
ncbi:MAG: hypothetical protein AAFP26_00395 [Planctomycetota bacterium]